MNWEYLQILFITNIFSKYFSIFPVKIISLSRSPAFARTLRILGKMKWSWKCMTHLYYFYPATNSAQFRNQTHGWNLKLSLPGHHLSINRFINTFSPSLGEKFSTKNPHFYIIVPRQGRIFHKSAGPVQLLKRVPSLNEWTRTSPRNILLQKSKSILREFLRKCLPFSEMVERRPW